MTDLLERLRSGDADALVEAVKSAARTLAAAPERAQEGDPLVLALKGHATHAHSKVRQSVADAALHFPDAAYEEVLTQLLVDPNVWVKNAIKATYDERSRSERRERTSDARSAKMGRLRSRIEAMSNPEVLRLADELCTLSTDQFVGRLAHELNKVAGLLERALVDAQTFIERGTLDRARLGLLVAEARSALRHLLDITKNAHAHARPTKPRFREENVRRLVEEQVGLLRRRIGEDQLPRLRVDLHIDDALTFDVDRGLFAQALANLLQNAVEAYPAGGEKPIAVVVRAELRKAGGLVAITVEDRGAGIAQSDLAQIGGPFLSTKGEGRGLGLLNVRTTVEGVHGGEWVPESELGVGTKMRMVVPRKQKERVKR
jgi:signal transduction histidine kinase